MLGHGRSRDPVEGRSDLLLVPNELEMLLLPESGEWATAEDDWVSEIGTQKLRLVGFRWKVNGVLVVVGIEAVAVPWTETQFGASNEFDFRDLRFWNEFKTIDIRTQDKNYQKLLGNQKWVKNVILPNWQSNIKNAQIDPQMPTLIDMMSIAFKTSSPVFFKVTWKFEKLSQNTNISDFHCFQATWQRKF